MTTTSHRDRALNHLEASLVARDTLTDLYGRGVELDRRLVAELHEQVRLGVKLAQVEALLAIGHTLRELLEDDVLDVANLDRIVAGRA